MVTFFMVLAALLLIVGLATIRRTGFIPVSGAALSFYTGFILHREPGTRSDLWPMFAVTVGLVIFSVVMFVIRRNRQV